MAAIAWTTIATFATAVGTLVLAVATFASVRSANRAARVAEEGFLVSLRPVLVTSKLEDPIQKVRWVDDRWSHVAGSQASVEVVDDRIYLAASLRNVGSGIAVLFGWAAMHELARSDIPHTEPEAFRMQTRDIYIPAGDVGFWQGAIREPDDPDYVALTTLIKGRNRSRWSCSMATMRAGSARLPALA